MSKIRQVGNLLLFTLAGFFVLLLARFYPRPVRFCDDVPKHYKPIYCGKTLSAARNDATEEILVVTSYRSLVEHQFGAVETWLNTQQLLSLPYIQEMVHIAIVSRRSRILVLGLGGGAIPFLLHRFCSYCNVIAVDVDPDALHITRQFVHADDGIRTMYVRNDAARFVDDVPISSFDIVMDDVYVGHERPKAMQSLQYLQQLYGILTPGGRYIVNVCTPINYESSQSDIIKQLEEVFDQVSSIVIPDTQNTIIMASKT